MDDEWECILQQSVTSAEELAKYFPVNVVEIRQVIKKYPMRINPYFLKLAKEKGDALQKQVIPDIQEIYDTFCVEDPLEEERDSPVPNITHRYPDRVLFLVSKRCAAYCRFCTRKRKVGKDNLIINSESIKKGIDYIRCHPKVRDVILSGGDPLLLSDDKLEWIISEVRKIPHVEIIRIGTRVPCVLPQRITEGLCHLLKKHHPLYINVHFNHPEEITPESKSACEMLADAGIPLGNQSVLLRGVNDDAAVMSTLAKKLLAMRVKPYYIFQADVVKGTNHFRTSAEKGIELIGKMRGFISGMAVPNFVIDAPGGGGKIPLLPNYAVKWADQEILLRNFRGELYTYPQVQAPGCLSEITHLEHEVDIL